MPRGTRRETSEALEVQRTPEGQWTRGKSGSPSTRFGQPGGNKPGRRPGRTLLDSLKDVRTTGGDKAAVEALYRVAADPDHPHWAAAQKMLWTRTDGLPVRQVMVGTIERQLLEGIELHPAKLDVPLPISTRGTGE